MIENNTLNQYISIKRIFIVCLLFVTLSAFIIIVHNQNEEKKRSLVSFENPNIQTTITKSAVYLVTSPQAEQKNCPHGFYHFENKDFSICYPDTMRVNPSQHIENSNGTETNKVYFSNATRTLTVLPAFTAAGTGPCFQQTPIHVSGLNAIRQLNTSVTYEKCGRLHEVATIITREDGQRLYLYETTKVNESIDLNEYIQIESSLQVK
jgi:hypothetical protein